MTSTAASPDELSSFTLPDFALYPSNAPAKAHITWVYWDGYIGYGPISLALGADGHTIDPSSAISHPRFRADTFITVGHPEPGDTEDYHRWLLNRLSGRVVLVGLSWGGKRASDFYRWYHQLPASERTLRKLGILLLSTPPSASELKSLQRLGTKVFSKLPVSWGRSLMRVLAPLFVLPGDRIRLRRQGRSWLTPLLVDSMRRSRLIIANLRDIASSTGFGPELKTGRRALMVHLPPKKDEVVKVTASRRSTKGSYPEIIDLSPALRHVLQQASHHAMIATDGWIYREIIKEAHRHFAGEFDLPQTGELV